MHCNRQFFVILRTALDEKAHCVYALRYTFGVFFGRVEVLATFTLTIQNSGYGGSISAHDTPINQYNSF